MIFNPFRMEKYLAALFSVGLRLILICLYRVWYVSPYTQPSYGHWGSQGAVLSNETHAVTTNSGPARRYSAAVCSSQGIDPVLPRTHASLCVRFPFRMSGLQTGRAN